MQMIKKILISITLIAAAWLIGYIGGRNYTSKPIPSATVDTLFVRDTLIVDKPAEVRYEQSVETILVPIHDTTIIHDTTYLVLRREIKEYQGEDYFARVSGYNPCLDYIEVYPKNVVISKTETTTQSVTKCNQLVLGIEAEYLCTPYIPIYLEYSRMLHKNIGIYGRLIYDLPTRTYGAGLGAKLQIEW